MVMPENFDPKPLQDRERYDKLNKLGRFKLTLEAFQNETRRLKLILEAAQDLPDMEPRKEQLIKDLMKELDAWKDSVRVVLEDHIAPLVSELAPGEEEKKDNS